MDLITTLVAVVGLALYIVHQIQASCEEAAAVKRALKWREK